MAQVRADNLHGGAEPREILLYRLVTNTAPAKRKAEDAEPKGRRHYEFVRVGCVFVFVGGFIESTTLASTNQNTECVYCQGFVFVRVTIYLPQYLLLKWVVVKYIGRPRKGQTALY